MNRPYEKPAMLECKQHPGTGLWCREDGCVLVPESGKHKAHWTFGSKKDTGYMMVGFRGRLYLVHRLVAQTFLDNPLNLPTVDHISRDRLDNRPSNLRYASYKTQADNKQCVDEALAKYGVRQCEDPNAYQRALRANNPEFAERERATCRERYAKNAERERARKRKWRAEQRALGKHRRRCPDGKRRMLTDEEFAARFGNNPQQTQLF